MSASTSIRLDNRDRAIRELIARKESARRDTKDNMIMMNDNVSSLENILSHGQTWFFDSVGVQMFCARWKIRRMTPRVGEGRIPGFYCGSAMRLPIPCIVRLGRERKQRNGRTRRNVASHTLCHGGQPRESDRRFASSQLVV